MTTTRKWWTSAPESYDYDYVKTIGSCQDKRGKVWRFIEESDSYRFQNFQKLRYQSGLHLTFEPDSDQAKYLELDSKKIQPV